MYFYTFIWATHYKTLTSFQRCVSQVSFRLVLGTEVFVKIENGREMYEGSEDEEAGEKEKEKNVGVKVCQACKEKLKSSML